MPIVSHVKLGIVTQAAVPEDLVERWKIHLKECAPEIYERIRKVVPDETRFQSVIADAASRAWSPVLAPNFVGKDGKSRAVIVARQANKLRQAYNLWVKKLTQMFETVDGIPAKRFKDQVDLVQPEYLSGMASWTLPFTGITADGRGPAPKAGRWLTGDQTVNRMLTGSDTVLEGGPYRVCGQGKTAGFKAMLIQRLIEAGNNIIRAGYDPAIMTAENQKTAEEAQGFVDPALDLIPFTAGGDSKVDYIVQDGNLYLEIKVSKM